MKPERFFVPGSLLVERQIRKEGPSPVFVAWRPYSSMMFTDRKALLQFAAWPASTPTGQEFRKWLDSFDAVADPEPEVDLARLKAEGFGPEQHEDDPTAQTRMVT